MTKEEFQKYVIAEAKKHLFSTENKSPKVIKESSEEIDINYSSSITTDDIKRLAEEMKHINKKIDLRNPLISESNESLVGSILNNSKKDIQERYLDVDDINKKKHISFQNEGEKQKWNRMLNYNVPNDEQRD